MSDHCMQYHSGPKYLVLVAVNHLLINRVAGGPNNQQNKSNNNVKIRPGATEFIQTLYDSGLFHIGFYSSMNFTNLNKVVKIILQGSQTGMSITKNISLLPDQTTTISLPDGNYYVIKNKSLYIQRVNEDRMYMSNGKYKFNAKNTVIIDIEEEDSLSICVPKFNVEDTNDNWMKILDGIFKWFINTEKEIFPSLAEIIREYFVIMMDIQKNPKS